MYTGLKRGLSLILLSFYLISCSYFSPLLTNDKIVENKKNWYEVFYGAGVNVYRVSMIPINKSTQRKKNLAHYYKIKDDFATPEQLIGLLKSSNRNVKLTKDKKLEWAWGRVKYSIPNIDYYRVQETREDTGTYDIVAYINQSGLDKIKSCLVMYSENIGTLSSEPCIKKYRTTR